MKIDILRRKRREIKDLISKKEQILALEQQKSKFYRQAAASLWSYENNGIFLSSRTPSEKFYSKEILHLKCSLIAIDALIAFKKIKAR